MAEAGEPEFKKKEREPITWICFIIFLVACIAVVGVYVNDHYIANKDVTIQYGDSITYEYAGALYGYYTDESGTVVPVIFDTNIESVGKGDYAFITDCSDKKFSPASLTIGSKTTVGNFESQFIGHKVGETFQVFIEKGTGYVGPETNHAGTVTNLNAYLAPRTMSLTTFNEVFGYDKSYTFDGVLNLTYKVGSADIPVIATNASGTVSVMLNLVAGESYVVADSKVGKVTLKLDGADLTMAIEGYKTVTGQTVTAGSVTVDEIEMISFDLLDQHVNIVGYDGSSNFVANSKSITTDSKGNTTIHQIENQALYFVVKIVSKE